MLGMWKLAKTITTVMIKVKSLWINATIVFMASEYSVLASTDGMEVLKFRQMMAIPGTHYTWKNPVGVLNQLREQQTQCVLIKTKIVTPQQDAEMGRHAICM